MRKHNNIVASIHTQIIEWTITGKPQHNLVQINILSLENIWIKKYQTECLQFHFEQQKYNVYPQNHFLSTKTEFIQWKRVHAADVNYTNSYTYKISKTKQKKTHILTRGLILTIWIHFNNLTYLQLPNIDVSMMIQLVIPQLVASNIKQANKNNSGQTLDNSSLLPKSQVQKWSSEKFNAYKLASKLNFSHFKIII